MLKNKYRDRKTILIFLFLDTNDLNFPAIGLSWMIYTS